MLILYLLRSRVPNIRVFFLQVCDLSLTFSFFDCAKSVIGHAAESPRGHSSEPDY
jgi:hypothetical protein